MHSLRPVLYNQVSINQRFNVAKSTPPVPTDSSLTYSVIHTAQPMVTYPKQALTQDKLIMQAKGFIALKYATIWHHKTPVSAPTSDHHVRRIPVAYETNNRSEMYPA